MALPPCLRLSTEVFPLVRARAAALLVANGWSQERTGATLGMSQAMVSRHVSRGALSSPAPDALVERLAQELAAQARHPEPAASSPWCATLAGAADPDGQEGRLALLEDLLAAEAQLVAAPVLQAVPQIGMNLALAGPAAEAPHEVLAYPARLIAAQGRLLSPMPPAWGGSQHLATCLLALKACAPVQALASVRGGPAVLRAARHLGWEVGAITGERPDGEAAFRRAIASAPHADAWHDPGDVGLEPCLYIPGASIQAVAASILRLEFALREPRPRP